MGGIGVFIIFIGAIAGMSVVNGTVGLMFKQSSADLFGTPGHTGFLVWVAAIIIIAAGLKALDLPQVGKAFVVLLFIVFLLSDGGLLTTLEQDIKSIGSGAPAPTQGTPGK